MKAFIKTFNELDKSDVKVAGGKGASLGEMRQNDISVPDGFVVLADVFDRFSAEADLTQEIIAILSTVNTEVTHTVENASEQIQGLIMSKQMPEDIKSELVAGFKNLGSEFVAVRSSATSEDSADAAWAGQLDSYLNTTESALLENVQKCWASLFTPRAIFYRFEKNLHNTFISVAVVVQEMVNSEKSGIAFSVHPVTEDHNQLIIEAGLGLGEAIVSGSITPDSYVVTKNPREIIDIKVSIQNKALYLKVEGGNEWQNLGKIGETQVLDETQIHELSDLIIKIEDHYGFPCDIEWAMEDNEFYIVQSRPITTLAKSFKHISIYKKFFTRNIPLVVSQLWWDAEHNYFSEHINGVTRFNPLFTSQTSTEVFYDINNTETAVNPLFDYFVESIHLINQKLEDFDELSSELKSYLEQDKNIETFIMIYDLFTKFWSYLPILVQLPLRPDVFSESIITELKRARDKSQYIEQGAIKWLEEFCSAEYGADGKIMTYKELAEQQVLSSREISERRQGYILFEGRVYPRDIKKIEQEFNLEIQNLQVEIGNIDSEVNYKNSELIGISAFPGKVTGRVRIVRNFEDSQTLKIGEVMVSPMTTPDYLGAIKKVAAIVTDEGGITCHAAIIAREMKVPCVIGTKCATEVLNDGDLVEVDSDNGTVRILVQK